MKIKDFKRFYVESPQNNPINYITLYKNKEGLINTTDWFKCRDFFKDAVSNCGEIYSLPSDKVGKYKFNNPIKGYWFWFSDKYNSTKDQLEYLKDAIHSNGMNNFLTLFKET
jgi:hypothetical protein